MGIVLGDECLLGIVLWCFGVESLVGWQLDGFSGNIVGHWHVVGAVFIWMLEEPAKFRCCVDYFVGCMGRCSVDLAEGEVDLCRPGALWVVVLGHVDRATECHDCTACELAFGLDEEAKTVEEVVDGFKYAEDIHEAVDDEEGCDVLNGREDNFGKYGRQVEDVTHGDWVE